MIEFKQPDKNNPVSVDARLVAAVVCRGQVNKKPRTGLRLVQGCPDPIIVEEEYSKVLERIRAAKVQAWRDSLLQVQT